MASLPVFHTTSARQDDIQVEKLARDVLGGHDLRIDSRGATTAVRGLDVTVDADRARGGVWAGDLSRLWGDPRIDVPKDDQVAEIARTVLDELRLTPELTEPFRYTEPGVRRSKTVTDDDNGRSVDEGEATYARDVVVDVSGRPDIPGDALPVFGGGGRFRATVGDGGQIVGVHGVWRDAFQADELPVRSVEEAIEAAGLSRDGKNVRVTGAQLGYYSAPSFAAQDLLFPVYAVTADVRNGDEWIPSRVTLVPATELGEVTRREAPVPDRTEGITLSPAVLRDVITPGRAVPSDLTVSSAALRRRGIQPENVLTRGPSGSIFIKPGLTGIDLSALLEAIRPRSFGASWIGSFGGLGGSQGNAQGFVDEMSAEGWQRRFNWGNQAAWKSDWISNDDQYVDDVDFVFYTGHAGPDGWMLATGGAADWLNYTEIGAQPNNPSDHWGRNNLEWAVIAACGPLEDDIINGGGNVHDRWRGVFDGLHLLLGYAAVTFDNEEEGRRIASYARSGMTLRQAWFRAAQEIQPSTNTYGDPYGPDIYAAAYYIGNSTANTADDHLWGRGTVGPDIRNSTYRACTYSPC
ncbi:DUF6345 domain-containing protein [Microbacterium sp. AZCO]|uniref:DUF6345 domain-containing protein n=1 Tax=Microbacterium sp. AZCO TaxID=3142976 RepID=UPI0031F3EF8D